MPMHLQALPRRTFLHRFVAGAGGLLLATRRVAAAPGADGHTWAMLSDPHIAADPEELGRGINMTDHLRQVCQEIVALQRAPAGVIVHGDCAFSTGRRGDYAQLLKLLQPLRADGLPIHLALGNHDHLQRFLAAVQPTDPSAIANKYVSLVESQHANFLILDSLDGSPPSRPGRLGEDQLRWLASELDARQEKPAIVVVHHNPPKLTDAPRLLTLLDERKQVKALFHGHRHIWGLDQTAGGVHLVNLLPTSYPSPKWPAPAASGWVLARLSADAVRLQVRCIDQKHPLHESIHHLPWRPG